MIDGDAVGSGTVWRTEHGTGPSVVLVHGTMDRSTSFGRVVRSLDDHHVVRYDRRGYGRSVDLGPPVSFAQQVDDLLEVVASVGSSVVVAGHSYGGTIALGACARDAHDIAGLVVYECPLPWMPWWPERSAGASAVADAVDAEDAGESFMRRMIGDDRWMRLPPSTRRARRAEGSTLVAEMGHLRVPGPPPFRLEDVDRPVVAANGATGATHHKRSTEAVARAVPDGRRVEIAGAGHGVHLSHPSDLAALIRSMAAPSVEA